MTAKSKKQPGPAHAPSTPHTTRPLAGISFLEEDEILANLDFTQLIPPPKHGGKHVMLTNKQILTRPGAIMKPSAPGFFGLLGIGLWLHTRLP